MSATAERPQLPFDRPGVLEIAPEYQALHAHCPVSRVATPAGDPAWLVTGYAAAKALFADARLGRSHPHPQQAARISQAGFMGGPMGNHATEAADHARLRRLLVPAFSAKRMRRLSGDITALVEELITGMITSGERGGPVDLHQHLSAPLPVYVICRLLGVPAGDYGYFKDLSERAATMTGEDPTAARDELASYTAGLAEAKRAHPGTDVLSDLVAAQRDDPTLSEGEIADIAAGLLFAGHETTLHRIDFGVLLLLANPAAHQALLDDPGIAPRVVEEILRLAAPGDFGIARYAHDEITLGDGPEQVTIAPGEAVILATTAANRDNQAFTAPEMFDPTRASKQHLTFGFGPDLCIGATLARTELTAVFSSLFSRLPTLQLATKLEELQTHTERITGGLDSLPITW
jgi:cytochrome P450